MGRVVPTIPAKDETNQFLRGHVLSMEDCVSKHFARALSSVHERSWTVWEIIRIVKIKFTDFVLGRSVSNNSNVKFTRAAPFLDVLLLYLIGTVVDGVSSRVPSSIETHWASSSRSKKDCENPPKCSTKCWKNSTIRTLFDVTKASL